MKERPILFSGEMVRAILEGRKTQTRRVLKPMSKEQGKWLTPSLLGQVPSVKLCDSTPGVDDYGVQLYHPKGGPLGWIGSKYGKVGDRLWVREAWAISELCLQPVFKICVNENLICKYIADFQYYENGKPIVEDWKGKRTKDFNLKAKLFKALYPDFELRITGRDTRASK